MTNPTPHLTHLTLTDDELQALNALIALALINISANVSLGTVLHVTGHVTTLLEQDGMTHFRAVAQKLGELGAANPNFDCQEVFF